MQKKVNQQALISTFNAINLHCLLPLLFVSANVFFAPNAFAQVYKCTFFDQNTQQNKTVYTDAPCAKSAKQTLPNIQSQSRLPNNQPASEQAIQTDNNATLDNAVTQALLDKNFALAQSLAQTKEHWRLIAVAQKVNATETLATTRHSDQTALLNACAQAKSDYEYTARTDWRDNVLVAMKKDEMDAVCNGAPPQPVQTTVIGGGQFYNYPYGGVGASRWIGGQRFRGGNYNKYSNDQYLNNKYLNARPNRPNNQRMQTQSGTRSEHATTFYKRN